ncbi:MAG: DUF5334 family protein [Sphingomonadales bacterium]
MRLMVNILCACCLLTSPVSAWDGEDEETGGGVTIEKGNLVRAGQDIEIYDQETGEYHDVTVESIRSSGSGATVDVYDNDTGEYRTLDME